MFSTPETSVKSVH